MTVAKKGDWVQIHSIILTPSERAPQIPEETRKVPLELTAKGFLQNNQASMGESVIIKTLADRELIGKLITIRPLYKVNYGEPQPELLTIGSELRAILREVKSHG
ncbi:MAG: 2-amino-4-ketopentanoate thiolase [Negativicutes bacterium]|nr:2-amino-4-ketopentanoate thiolase [Negativicutes bacterium]